MKQIYILLSKTDTVPSQLIYKMTHGAFTHVSLALTPHTNRFYSYGRRKIHNPLKAGFLIEDLHSKVFAQYPNCNCALYSIEISEEAYKKIRSRLRFFLRNYKKTTYNFLGIVPLRLGIPFRRKYKLVCSQFVALLLEASTEIELPKDPYLMLPIDFMRIPNIRKIYEGSLGNCHFGTAANKLSFSS
ncbi:MAG: hypothetical protein E7668_00250 [Ruminococcaceae bacterium]|nr:hypothetical protein [Oscillospiraceae bacterium]